MSKIGNPGSTTLDTVRRLRSGEDKFMFFDRALNLMESAQPGGELVFVHLSTRQVILLMLNPGQSDRQAERDARHAGRRQERLSQRKLSRRHGRCGQHDAQELQGVRRGQSRRSRGCLAAVAQGSGVSEWCQGAIGQDSEMRSES